MSRDCLHFFASKILPGSDLKRQNGFENFFDFAKIFEHFSRISSRKRRDSVMKKYAFLLNELLLGARWWKKVKYG